MSQQGLFSFDGTSIVPVACLVRPWIDDDIDPIDVREQACSVHVGDFNEVWWFFPQLGQPVQHQGDHLHLQGGMVDAGPDVALGGHHGVLHRAHRSWPTSSSPSSMRWATTYANANVPVVCRGPRRSTSTSLGGSRLITVKQMMPDVEGDRCRPTCSIRCSTETAAASCLTRLSVSLCRCRSCKRRRARSRSTAMSTSAPPAATSGCASTWRRR